MEDKLCVQFMARILQFRNDHKDFTLAEKLTKEEFYHKIHFGLSAKDAYYFIDESIAINYGNNRWEVYDY